MRYAVFLRGINVGGNKTVVMSSFKTELERLGFTQVKTLLNSGNVVLTSPKPAAAIVQHVVAAVGFELAVMVWSKAELDGLVKADPFAETPEDAKRYVSFCARPLASLTLPIRWNAYGLEAFAAHRRAVMVRSVPLEQKPRPGYPPELERALGVATTRTWATVLKVHAALAT
jgi:uncharacterized protein (DUF1697 family)